MFDDWYAMEEDSHPASMQESVQEWARNIGFEARYVDRQWLLHDFDVWVRNPHYVGPPQRHPEEEPNDDWYVAQDQAVVAAEAAGRDPNSVFQIDDDSQIPF